MEAAFVILYVLGAFALLSCLAWLVRADEIEMSEAETLAVALLWPLQSISTVLVVLIVNCVRGGRHA